ncbi:histidine kinase [Saccharopolyspora sp. K220]|uniref:sensor histidine kinase n=1 Tax=Saccharopolyspora soli TaxID=2926618 RepID=UPI001F55E647|nr:histidine kinase [Saccharopolyspora soli]MCI2420660.1 histidine kinase [Saccharopolyspora soli]
MSETDAGDFDPRRIRHLRRYTWWSIVPTLPVFAAFPVLNLVLGALQGFYNAVEIVVLSVIVLVIAVHGTRLCASLMKGLGRGEQRPAVDGVVFVLSLGAMVYALLRDQSGLAWAMLLSGLAGAHISAAPRRLRWPMTIGVLGLTGVTAAVAVSPINPLLAVDTGVYIMLIVGVIVSLMVGVAWFWDIVLELDRARAVSAELAIAKERLRFAADLHDIQGHHLQAIALKAELAERLVGTDDDAARRQAAEVAELARTALKDTREVVQGYRRSNLTTELDNAREILEAAGIQTTVDGDATRVPPPLQPLFGALVREGTTNILRHSHAERCELSICVDGSRTLVVLRNDRANPPNGASGSGIDGLRQRFGTLGGWVDTDRVDDRFELRGSAEEPGRTP